MALREGLLVLLEERPRHGYDLRVEFEQQTGALWPLNSGQVYTTLDRLERDGLVASQPDEGDASGRRRLYRVTTDGRSAMRAWLRTPDDVDHLPRDELVMKVLLALAISTEKGRQVIAAHRRTLLQRLQQLQRDRRDDPAPPTLAGELVADALIGRLEADLRWLDRSDERLAAATEDGGN